MAQGQGQDAAQLRSGNGASPDGHNQGQDDEDELDEGLREVGPDGLDAERRRLLAAHDQHEEWFLWGPYLSERQWGTVREDYSPGGTAWDYFPHDHARSRAYRWGEDGLLGICDDHGLLCFGVALWNEADPILKERLFGLTGPEGNHGEDVKEYFFYLDNTPTHSYMKALYRYPQRAFPYSQLVEVNHQRTRQDPEFELIDTGVLAENRYFDVTVEYAKAGPHDLLVRITCVNQGPEPARLQLLPSLWFRNTWRWGLHERYAGLALAEPPAGQTAGQPDVRCIQASHYKLGSYWLACQGSPDILFTENETNNERLWGSPNDTPYVKDGIDNAVVHGRREAVNPQQNGTKAAAHYQLDLGPGESQTVLLRLGDERQKEPFAGADAIFARRQAEADAFYAALRPPEMDDDAFLVMRQSFAGLLWCKQHYRYDVARWLKGDPAMPPPPPERLHGRNHDWQTLNNNDVMSMPAAWEYPWYASWDLAFHTIPLAMIDPEYAKHQLILLLREWFMHPNGQLPAYEWAFSDVNPPVHAWAAFRVYKIEERLTGRADRLFLERVFQKLLLNFDWWVNRKDVDGRNVFQGGFLGLDNIGVFDRTVALPTGGHLDQADGTAWMGLFCLSMLAIALELARTDRAYEDMCIKFFEHFLYIAGALNNIGESVSIWNEDDGFFYDVLHLPDGTKTPLKVRSLVGVIPLFAVETIEPEVLEGLPQFASAFHWFLAHRPDLAALVSRWDVPGQERRRLLSLVHGHRMKRVLSRVLDPQEFLSDCGVRSVSKYHRDHPYQLTLDGTTYSVDYEPGESTSGIFGGNSNWRGPVWFPLNYLLIESIQKYHHYYGDDFLIECPTGSGRFLTLWQVADDLSRRLTSIFLRDSSGRRPVFGDNSLFQEDPRWRDNVLFYEYFHGETGAGLGASHQTGWTALVAKLLEQTSRMRDQAADRREFALATSRR